MIKMLKRFVEWITNNQESLDWQEISKGRNKADREIRDDVLKAKKELKENKLTYAKEQVAGLGDTLKSNHWMVCCCYVDKENKLRTSYHTNDFPAGCFDQALGDWEEMLAGEKVKLVIPKKVDNELPPLPLAELGNEEMNIKAEEMRKVLDEVADIEEISFDSVPANVDGAASRAGNRCLESLDDKVSDSLFNMPKVILDKDNSFCDKQGLPDDVAKKLHEDSKCSNE